jgi:hypothetical protein
MKTEFYTYAFLREDGTPYYIGKGRGNRCYSNNGRHSCNRPAEKSRILILKKNLTEEEAFKHEIYMIAVFGRKDLGTGILRNLSNGGEGPSGYTRSEDHRRKLREANRGQKRSEEAKRRMSEASKRKKHSIETRLKMSQSHEGKEIKVVYNNQSFEFPSISAASSTLGIPSSTISHRLNNPEGRGAGLRKRHSRKWHNLQVSYL